MIFVQSKNVAKSTVFVVFLLSLLLLPLSVYAREYPVQWTPERIEETLGFDGMVNIPVTFVSSTELEDVDLRVVPSLQHLVSVTPSHFGIVVANVPYNVTVHLAVPHGTYPGLYDGTIHLVSGRKTYPQTLKVNVEVFYEGVSIPETTKVLDNSTTQNLLSVSPDGSTLIFSELTPQLELLGLGDIIVIGVTPITPNGLLRRVTNILVNGQVIVETTQTTLEEAIEECSVEFSANLTPGSFSSATSSALESDCEGRLCFDEELYDGGGVQIRANGYISVNTGFEFDLKIEDHQVEELSFANVTTEELVLTVTAEANGAIHESRKFEPWPLPVITIWVGWLPIIIKPAITITVGIDGEAVVGISTTVTQEATLRAGLSYYGGAWHPFGELSNSFDYEVSPPLVTGKVKGYVTPKLDLKLYGIAGPYVGVEGYLELDADMDRTPTWILYGGLEVFAGVEVVLFGRNILPKPRHTLHVGVLPYEVKLAEASVQGRIAGTVRDAANRDPLQGVSVAVYDQYPPSGPPIADGTTDARGDYSFPVPAGSGYTVEFSKADYLTVPHEDVTVVENAVTHLEQILAIDNAHSGPGSVGGIVVNALNGVGVPDLTINLRAGINAKSGAIVENTTTRIDGRYIFENIEAGNYTAEASGSGYITTYFTVTCIGNMSTVQDATITPVLEPGETRIILTWDVSPRDLDSHLTGPLPSGGRFHVYYANRTVSPYADLDRDDVTSYGPETITIRQKIPGMYRYSVHDYTNRGSSSSDALSNSSAQVRVYRGSDLVEHFNVPADEGGTLWTVFELNGDTDIITPINIMSYESSPSSIQSVSTEMAETDAALMVDLPPKTLAPDMVPLGFELAQNFPNSFNPETWIPYKLAKDVDVTIRIHSAVGRLVRTLDLGHKTSGFYSTKDKAAYWNGRNEAGEQVSSGVYFYTIHAGEFTATKKMIVTR